MPTLTPTDAQRELAEEDGSRLVEACPGAGKTRAIVARFVRQARRGDRRGVALLSFTNAAVDEVSIRCSAEPATLAVPNFLGTFDSFINRFLVAPAYVHRLGQYPRFTESWAAVRTSGVSIDGMTTGVEYDLDWFSIDAEMTASLIPGRISGKFGNYLRAHYPDSIDAINAAATKTLRRLVMQRGLVSASASRALAVRVASDERRATCGELLAARFREVIVDEAQDCGSEEIMVLRLLREFEVDVVAVADLDQSIYEFRNADPSEVRGFADDLSVGTRLDGNFRSTPAICALNRSLRHGQEPDEPCGPFKHLDWPVFVTAFDTLDQLPQRIREILAIHDIPIASVHVIAHKTADARAAAAATSADEPSSTRKSLRFAAAALAIRPEQGDTRKRRNALVSAERAMLELVVHDGHDEHSVESLREALGIDPRWLRSSVLRVCSAVDPRTESRSSYAVGLRQQVQALDWPVHLELKALNHQLAAAPADDWNELMAGDHEDELAWGTVHSVKGAQFDAVALVIPEGLVGDSEGRTPLDLWEQGIDGEGRRVLYVGASRAERVQILAVHAGHFDRVSDILDRDGVPREVV